MSKLAILGGKPVRKTPFPSQNTMDEKEINAVIQVMKGGRLSGYRASWGKEFWGGPCIQALEGEWQKRFNVKHAIPVNSCTSGLQIACGAIGLGPGDEVICTPYSMTISATAPLMWGAVPVFADVLDQYHSLDPKSVEEKITPNTKAILVVSLFGQPYSWEINKIARKHNLVVIEDAAQAIGSYMYGKDTPDRNETIAAGTMGDIGIFSFNYGKHLSCGESGMIVTNDDNLAIRIRLLMNHSEAVLSDMKLSDNKQYNKLADMKHIPGFNMRMTELNACIVSEQLKKFDKLLNQRIDNVQALKRGLEQIPPISFYPTMPNCTHSYYTVPFEFNSSLANGLHRNKFINAVKAELPPRIHRESEDVGIGNGYILPIYRMPIFNQPKGLCPVTEELYENKLFLTILHAPNSTVKDMVDICEAFQKVWEYHEDLLK